MTARDTDLSNPDEIQLLMSRVRMEYARRRQRERRLRAMWVITTILAAVAAWILIAHFAGAF